MRSISVVSTCSLVSFLLFSAQASAALSFSAVDDFSIASNPNTVWSYQAAGALLTSAVSNCGGSSDLVCWTNNGSYSQSASVIKNTSASTVTASRTVVIPVDHLNLDPQGVANVEVVFTAPTPGIYTIVGNFLGDDTGEQSHAVQVLDNSTVIYSSIIGAYGQLDSFNLSAAVAAGDRISFVSDTGSSFTNLGTGLAATITSNSVPEPTSAALLAFGLLGTAGVSVAQRRR